MIDYEKFFKYSVDILSVVSPEVRFIDINPAFEKTLGFSRAGVINTPVADFVHPEDRDATIRELSGTASRHSTEVFESRFLTKYGSYKWLQWSITPVMSENRVYAVMKDITEHKNLISEMRGLTLNDDLTGLYNRRGFFTFGENYLRRLPREKKTLLVICLDLSHTHAINEALGYPAGDKAIVSVSNIIRSSFRKTDIMARMGGDEFSVLAMINNEGEARAMIARVRAGVTAVNVSGELPCAIELNIGCATTTDESTYPIEQLLSKARNEFVAS